MSLITFIFGPILAAISDLKETVTMNQQETLDTLNGVNATLDKIAIEEQGLSDAVAALTAQLANQQNTPEVDAALALVQQKTAALDAIVPDAPAQN